MGGANLQRPVFGGADDVFAFPKLGLRADGRGDR